MKITKKINELVASFPLRSRWWVKCKDEVSSEPDALVEVTGWGLSNEKPQIYVRYVDYCYRNMTGTFKPSKLKKKTYVDVLEQEKKVAKQLSEDLTFQLRAWSKWAKENGISKKDFLHAAFSSYPDESV